MWGLRQIEVPTENRFLADRVCEMTRDGFQIMAGKRRRTNTGQSDSEHRSVFSLSNGDDKFNIMFDEILRIRKTQDKMYQGMLSFQNCLMNVGEKMTQVIRTTNRNTDMLKTLAYKSIDIEARSRRNNLIFWGLIENRNENCFALIRQFIKNELDLDADKMYLARAHRLGPVKKFVGLRKRPLIVNFRDYCDIQSIMANAHLLRGTPFSVDYDHPKEIGAARKLLWDEIKSIKRLKPSAKCQIVYPAKLLVDGKVARDEFPDWSQAMKGSRLGDFSHIGEEIFSRDVNDQMSASSEPAPFRGININITDNHDTYEDDMSFGMNPASPVGSRDKTTDLDETVAPRENDSQNEELLQPSQSLITVISSNNNDLPDRSRSPADSQLSQPSQTLLGPLTKTLFQFHKRKTRRKQQLVRKFQSMQIVNHALKSVAFGAALRCHYLEDILYGEPVKAG